MLGIHPHSVFDPEATEAMGDAFDRACGALGTAAKSSHVRESIANHIIEGASRGERDPQRLCALALSPMGMELLRQRRSAPQSAD